MALPTILVDSATGSDTQASGAGPSTALFGTTDASTDGAGTVVTLTAGTDLTNVATDGSHVIFLNDSTAGARNFGKITAKAGSGGATPTVTVANAFGTGLSSKSWAIGGKRASIGSTTSAKLFNNNSAAGDAMPGWIVEMQSGHTETMAATLTFHRAGNSTDGMIVLRGASGTRPILTFSNNGAALTLGASFIHFEAFELRNSNATKTASSGFTTNGISDGPWILRNIKIAHSTDKFYRCLNWTLNIDQLFAIECEFGYAANVGAYFEDGVTSTTLAFNYFHDCTSHGCQFNSNFHQAITIYGNVFDSNGGDGLNFGLLGSTIYFTLVAHNTSYGNTSDGFELTSSTGGGLIFLNNIASGNGGYGLRCSHASATAAYLLAMGARFLGNAFYNNTSGKYLPTDLNVENEQTADPQFTDAANGDFSIGTNLKGGGYPLGGTRPVGTASSTYSYVDPGAAQRQETGGGGADEALPPGNLSGGIFQ